MVRWIAEGLPAARKDKNNDQLAILFDEIPSRTAPAANVRTVSVSQVCVRKQAHGTHMTCMRKSEIRTGASLKTQAVAIG